MKTVNIFLTFLFLFSLTFPIHASRKADTKTFSGLKFRGIGPALMSGRIADIAVDPGDRATWYVAVGSGGLWKTVNAGTTWTPVFDDMPSYSLGCVMIDPGNPLVIWLGSGENSSGRHVGYGDGVYKSTDAGRSWSNMGLKHSEHIAQILVHPDDSDTVFVAAVGPLWSPGGERGVYKTEDGGTTWKQVLAISDNTGVCSLVMDPGDPDILYAAAYQRRRHVAAFMGGGPESGIYKTIDGGKTWKKINKGLPTVDMGKIGLAVSPQKPSVVYATVETHRGTDWSHSPGGFFRSMDRGENWEKRSDYFPVKWATGPHYYQELYPDPHRFDHIYQADAPLMLSQDGGKTWNRVPSQWRHGDHHALVFDPRDPDWLLAGTDGGVYESFDHGVNWRYFPNLPVTQIYKMAIDNDVPFYNVIGGTQDNSTQYGPTRTSNVRGIINADWRVTLGGDGYACAIDPEDPDTIYCEWQVGNLVRYDRPSGERIDIKPQPEPGEDPPRWNWDSPVIISPHSHTRLYFGSQRLYRSEDRGDSWTPLSGDLSRNLNRLRMTYMGRTWGPEAVFDQDAMSYFGNITAIDESPLVEGLLYCGTDDGLVQVSEDGGNTWRKIDQFPAVPEMAFVNDVEACRHDPDGVFLVLDNHKRGDFTPYVLHSSDRGRSWRSIRGDLPDRHIIWVVVQDHVIKDLLFAGTEFGIFFTRDGGSHWHRLEGGLPTIAFRDLKIQRRENDLVGASFGRGFFVLDDYTALRHFPVTGDATEALLFPVRPALQYVPQTPFGMRGKGTQGAGFFTGDNPPFGAVFTYYLPETIQTRQEKRAEADKTSAKSGKSVRYPDWEALRTEDRELKPGIRFTVRDGAGTVVRRIDAPASKGFHRVAWDLSYAPTTPVRLKESRREMWEDEGGGPMVLPGTYRVAMAAIVDGRERTLAKPMEFEVGWLLPDTLTEEQRREVLAFQQKTARLQRVAWASSDVIKEIEKRLEFILKGLRDTPDASSALNDRTLGIRTRLFELKAKLEGDWTILGRSEPAEPSIEDRISSIVWGQWNTRMPPTQTHRRAHEIAAADFSVFLKDLRTLVEEDLKSLERDMESVLAPWTPHRGVPVWKDE